MTSNPSLAADGDLLEKAVSKIARSSGETQKLTRKKLADAKKRNPSASDRDEIGFPCRH